MNVIRRYRQEIQKARPETIGFFLTEELDSLAARIQAGWNIQHALDGAHTDVTANSLSSGRHRYLSGDYIIAGIPGDPTGNGGPHTLVGRSIAAGAGLIRLQYGPAVTAVSVNVSEISPNGRDIGDTIILANDRQQGKFLILWEKPGMVNGSIVGILTRQVPAFRVCSRSCRGGAVSLILDRDGTLRVWRMISR